MAVGLRFGTHLTPKQIGIRILVEMRSDLEESLSSNFKKNSVSTHNVVWEWRELFNATYCNIPDTFIFSLLQEGKVYLTCDAETSFQMSH
jgi:hypothetical protein